MKHLLSETALSNLFTMGIASKKDPRQNIPPSYCIPPLEVRKLRARLILEEALETVQALGLCVSSEIAPGEHITDTNCLSFDSVSCPTDPNLLGIIDGCLDTIYVCVGTLCATGVPDLPHAEEVNRANNAKFPNGEATTDRNGKFQKPVNWIPPDHNKIADMMKQHKVNLQSFSEYLVRAGAS